MADTFTAMINETKSRLRETIAEIDAGLDVPPAQLLVLEQQLTFLLRSGAEPADLAELRSDLRDCGSLRIVVTEMPVRVELQLWQKRAPVVPTTKD